jgi:hypothetical protein
MTLDEIRAAHPDLAFALYAYEPGGEVTFEVMHGTEIFAFTGPTAQAAIDAAFPPEPPAPAFNVFD